MLRDRDLDLYLLSRVAGPPALRYPLWDREMEWRWANWLTEKEDIPRLGALLSVAKICSWDVSDSVRSEWEYRKQELNGRVEAPAVRILSERRIDTGMLRTALAAASVFRYVNWMYLNQALGWRVETTRVALILAVLVRIGALKPIGAWSEPHMLTKTGRRISRAIFGRAGFSMEESRKTIKDFLDESVETGTASGWAAGYGFDQLLSQITDASDQPDHVPSSLGEEEFDIEFAYDGLMGEQLRHLIEN